MITLGMYIAYLTISALVTVWVARTLHTNGRTFLIHTFDENESLADSINHLLVVGFYLINLGYVCYTLQARYRPEQIVDAVELLSPKIGLVLLVLGCMHFFNLYVFTRIARKGT